MPRGPTLNAVAREVIRENLSRGLSSSQIATNLHRLGVGVSDRQARRLMSNYRLYSTLEAPRTARRGRRPKLAPEIIVELLDFLHVNPMYDQFDMMTFLFDFFSVSVDQSTVSRCLSAVGWTQKKVQVIAAQKSEPLRLDWIKKIAEIDPRRLMFLDESSACHKTQHFSTGWSPFGVVPRVTRVFGKEQRFSILPAYTLDGYVACRIVKGSLDRERFLTFVKEEVLPICVRDWTVLVMDKCSTHRYPEITQMCADAGIRLEYLPPHSPDLNPIEASFATLKKWMTKHRLIAEEYLNRDDYEGFITLAVMSFQTGLDPGAHFRTSGYT